MSDHFFTHLPEKIINNKYQILSILGQGGMGAVYQARVINTQRIVAIKFLQDEASGISQKRFLREMEVSAQLQHKNITKTLDAGIFYDKTFMVMEYVKGRSLYNYCQDKGLSLEEKLHLIYKIADALAYAHRHKIIHRDIKPKIFWLTKMENQRSWILVWQK